MVATRQWSSLRIAIVGFFLATAVSLVTGIVGFGDPWQRVIVIAIANGVGLSVGLYLYHSANSDLGTAE